MNSLFYPLKTPENTKKRDVQSLGNGGEQQNTIRLSCVDRMFSVYFACISRASTVRLTSVKPYFLPWPAFIPIEDWGEFQNGMRVEKAIKKRFFGIYIEIKQLEVGHDVITMKLECHLKIFSTTSTIKGLGEAGTLDSTTRVPLTFCTFSRKTFWNIFGRSCYGKFHKPFSSTNVSAEAKKLFFTVAILLWEVRGAQCKTWEAAKVWNKLGNEAMCKGVSCFTYNDQTN